VLDNITIKFMEVDMAHSLNIRDIGDERAKKLDEQREKYGGLSQADYIRLLIDLDPLSNLVALADLVKWLKDNKKT
jgi:hypothetical protein